MKSNEKRGKNKSKSIKRKCQVFKCFDSFMSGVCATPCHCDINEWRTKGCKKFIITEAIESVNYCFCFPFVSDAIFWYIPKKMLNYLRFTRFYSYADWWFVFWPLFNRSFVVNSKYTKRHVFERIGSKMMSLIQ